MLKAAIKFFTQFSQTGLNLDMVVIHEVLLWEQEKNESNGREKEQCPSTRSRSQKMPGVLAGEATATKVTNVASFLKDSYVYICRRSHQILFSTITRKNEIFLGFKTV